MSTVNLKQLPSEFSANPNKRSAVHVAIYHRGHKLYEHYKETPKIVCNTVIPTVLMINRWDGRIGFPGGHIDQGETPEEALLRELKEEINFSPLRPDGDERKIHYVASWEGPTTNLHFYACEILDFQDMKRIVRDACLAEHFSSEITGTFLQHLHTYDNGMGLTSFLKSANLVPAVAEQVELICKRIR